MENEEKNLVVKNVSKKVTHTIDKLKKLIEGTQFSGHVFLVGGCVRDMFLGRPIKDIDIVVDLPDGGTVFANFITARTGCYKANSNPVVFSKYGTAKFQILTDDVCKDLDIECVHTRKEYYNNESRNPKVDFGTLEQDMARRDLTINAMYYNITTGKLYDSSERSGMQDINDKTIRTTSDPDKIYDEDPLRMLRTIRFATSLGWGIEKDTWLGIIKNAPRINIISKERIKDELSKILLCEKPSIGIRRLLASGLLREIIPDIYYEYEAREPKNNLITTFDHTMDVLDEVQPILEHRLAALFHDVGENTAKFYSKGTNPSSFSASVAEFDLKELLFPNSVIDAVSKAIKYHNYFSNESDTVTPKDSKIRRFLNDTGDYDAITLDLMEANNRHSATNKKENQVFLILKRMKEMEELDKAKNVKLPLNGNDIMQKFNIKGKKVGEMLSLLKENYFENPDITREECFKIISDKLNL